MKNQNQTSIVYMNPKREAGEMVYTFRSLLEKVNVCELCGHHQPVFKMHVVQAIVLAVFEDRALVAGNVVVKCLYRVRCICDDPTDFYECDDDGSKLFDSSENAQIVLDANENEGANGN